MQEIRPNKSFIIILFICKSVFISLVMQFLADVWSFVHHVLSVQMSEFYSQFNKNPSAENMNINEQKCNNNELMIKCLKNYNLSKGFSNL